MTKFKFYILVVTLLQSSLSATTNSTILFAEDTLEESHGKVIFASLLFRHGDRTITHSYENDPYPISIWKEGLGELTKVGKEQAYELGKWFKERYKNTLLTDEYNADQLLMQSSDVNRTIMSGLLVLAGAYPPTKNEIWTSDGLKWQPIPIHVISTELDHLIGNRAECERVKFEHELLTNNPQLQKLFSSNTNTIKYLIEKSGKPLPEHDLFEVFEQIWDLYDTLFIQDSNNLTLPPWTKSVYPEPLRTLASNRFETYSYTFELQRLIAGPLLGTMVSEMRSKRDDGASHRTIHFYSGHDTTLAPLLQLLGVYNKIAPPYCATVLVELRQKDTDYIVTVTYRNSTDAPPYLLKVPGCDDVCTLDKFIDVTKYLILTDWHSECEVTIFTRLQYLNPFNLIVILLVISIVGIIILVLLRISVEKKRRSYLPY